MNKKHLMIGAVAVLVGLLMLSKNKKAAAVKTVGGAPVSTGATQAALLATLANTQITLANGAVLDTGNGVIFDPITGSYTNTLTGAIIY